MCNEAVEKANHDPISTHLKFNFYPLTIGYELAAGKLILSLFQFRAINRSISGFAHQPQATQTHSYSRRHAAISP
ncbi:hypothetical protein OLMES_5337 [Oleiphilus messinensis]|uniref:Uncharacterized protein n=1 Tax=Oleiphilus messinensis TaxID=141451 RepID=A0A1Y0IFK9_9GAMM|nr:hypothetical protein OLMES_5337 [Oleiphilus messinensis]